MTTSTSQRTRAPHRYTPPLSVRHARASHTNGGLYAYAANSPVCYTDPDGESVIRFVDERLSGTIAHLYSNSETFKNVYHTLASGQNKQGKPLFVWVEVVNGNYAGNTQSQDGPLARPVDVLTYKDGKLSVGILDSGEECQIITISIDMDRVSSKNLNLQEVIAEEFVHSAEAARVGTAAWNERARTENKLPYAERAEEIKAKTIVKEILAEVKRNEENQ